MTNEEILHRIAKHIEVGGESYSGPGNYQRNGQWVSIDQCWEMLSEEDKQKRLREAMGAWAAIESIGVGMLLHVAVEQYLQEK